MLIRPPIKECEQTYALNFTIIINKRHLSPERVKVDLRRRGNLLLSAIFTCHTLILYISGRLINFANLINIGKIRNYSMFDLPNMDVVGKQTGGFTKAQEGAIIPHFHLSEINAL